MAYWIQEFGGNGQNRPNFRMYNCDFEEDVKNLPLNDRDGIQQGDDTVSYKKAHYGDRCMVLESANVYELGWETNEWVKLGGE